MKRVFCFVYCLLLPTVCFAEFPNKTEELSPAGMPAFEKGESAYVDKITRAPRSQLNYSIKRTREGTSTVYHLNCFGKGDWDKFTNVSCSAYAKLEERDGCLYPTYTSLIIQDAQGNEVVTYEKIFDYQGKNILWQEIDGKGRSVRSASFPLKGRTVDDITLSYFLRVYAAHRDQPAFNDYYFLTNEPRLFHINIKLKGEEELSLPAGKEAAAKLKLVTDIGFTEKVMDRLFPASYIWYEAQPPYGWLQYEGLETRLGSAEVTSFLTKRDYKP